MPTLKVKTTVTDEKDVELFAATSPITARNANDMPGLEIPRGCDHPIDVCAERKWLKFFAIAVEPKDEKAPDADAGASEEEKGLAFKTVDSAGVEGPELLFKDSVAFWGDSLKSMFAPEQNKKLAGILMSNRGKAPVTIKIFIAKDVMKKADCAS